MIHFTLNGQDLQIPSSWYDLTMRQFNAVSKPDIQISDVVSIFTGIPVETVRNSVLVGMDQLVISLEFLNKPMDTTGFAPTKLGNYTLPVNKDGKFDIQVESLGQFEDMRNDMKHAKTLLELSGCYHKFCARYLQKIRDGVYNPQKAVEMFEEILDMPAVEVMAVGGFFYLSIMSLSSGTAITSPPTPQNPKK